MAIEDFFTWGSGGRKMTPEQLAAERQALAVMQAREGDTSPVAHWSQGLGRVVNALAGNYRESKADKAEAAGIAQGQAAMAPVLAALMGGGSGGGYTAGGGASSAAAPEDALGLIREFEGFRETPYWDLNAYRAGYGSDTITMPDGSVVPVAQGMSVSRDDAERDLSRRVGTEFIPRAQEAVGPDVWAALNPQQQSSLASITYNYGSLPSNVAAAVQTPGIEDDVAAIRGLATHNGGINAWRRNREADIYGGVAGMGGQPQTTMSTQGQPAAQRDIISLLMAAQADPWARKQYGPVIDALMGSELSSRAQAQDPMYQLGLQKAQMEVDAMRNPAAPAPIEVGGVLLDPTTFQPIFDSRVPDVVKDPAAVQEYKFYTGQEQAAGRTPLSFNDWDLQKKKAGATSVTVGGAPELGKLSTDYAYLSNPDGTPIIDPKTNLPKAAPVPGSPAAIEAEKLGQKVVLTDANKATATEVITNAAKYAREADKARMVRGWAGELAAKNPGSQNAEVYRQVAALQANASAENIAAMRAASPSGAALGGVSDRDIQLLADKSGALNPASPNFARDLDDYERTVLRLVHGKEAGDRIFEATREGEDKPEPSPLSVKRRRWNPEKGAFE